MCTFRYQLYSHKCLVLQRCHCVCRSVCICRIGHMFWAMLVKQKQLQISLRYELQKCLASEMQDIDNVSALHSVGLSQFHSDRDFTLGRVFMFFIGNFRWLQYQTPAIRYIYFIQEFIFVYWHSNLHFIWMFCIWSTDVWLHSTLLVNLKHKHEKINVEQNCIQE
jgi:hypothetical protein